MTGASRNDFPKRPCRRRPGPRQRIGQLVFRLIAPVHHGEPDQAAAFLEAIRKGKEAREAIMVPETRGKSLAQIEQEARARA